MDSLKIMTLFTMTVAAKRLIFQPSGHNNQERLNMDLARLSFCWRNSQMHLKNSLCLPGIEKLSAITQINTRHGLNSDNLHLYALYMLIDQFEYTYNAFEQRHKISFNRICKKIAKCIFR